MESYGDVDHMYSNTLVHLQCWRQDYLLGSIATIVNLSKGIPTVVSKKFTFRNRFVFVHTITITLL